MRLAALAYEAPKSRYMTVMLEVSDLFQGERCLIRLDVKAAGYGGQRSGLSRRHIELMECQDSSEIGWRSSVVDLSVLIGYLSHHLPLIVHTDN